MSNTWDALLNALRQVRSVEKSEIRRLALAHAEAEGLTLDQIRTALPSWARPAYNDLIP